MNVLFVRSLMLSFLFFVPTAFSSSYRCEFKLMLVKRVALQEFRGLNACRNGELLNEVIYDENWDGRQGDRSCSSNVEKNTTSVLHARLIDQEPVVFEFNDKERGAKIISGGTAYNGYINAEFIIEDAALSQMPVKSKVELSISVFPSYLNNGAYFIDIDLNKYIYVGKLPDGEDNFVDQNFWFEASYQQDGGNFYQGYNSLFPVNIDPNHPLDYLMSPTGLASSKFHSDMGSLDCKKL